MTKSKWAVGELNFPAVFSFCLGVTATPTALNDSNILKLPFPSMKRQNLITDLITLRQQCRITADWQEVNLWMIMNQSQLLGDRARRSQREWCARWSEGYSEWRESAEV
jgi:hypothetical protein